ncbi:MAG: GtrA family protein [Terracoccus sp.]
MSAVVATRVALSQQLIRFSVVGAVSTVLNLALFATLVRGGMPNQVANGTSLVISTVANTAVNRLWTFGVSGREHLVAHHGQALLIFALTWTATTGALALLGRMDPHASTTTATLVVLLANVVATAPRFVAMRRWVFR